MKHYLQNLDQFCNTIVLDNEIFQARDHMIYDFFVHNFEQFFFHTRFLTFTYPDADRLKFIFLTDLPISVLGALLKP